MDMAVHINKKDLLLDRNEAKQKVVFFFLQKVVARYKTSL